MQTSNTGHHSDFWKVQVTVSKRGKLSVPKLLLGWSQKTTNTISCGNAKKSGKLWQGRAKSQRRINRLGAGWLFNIRQNHSRNKSPTLWRNIYKISHNAVVDSSPAIPVQFQSTSNKQIWIPFDFLKVVSSDLLSFPTFGNVDILGKPPMPLTHDGLTV